MFTCKTGEIVFVEFCDDSSINRFIKDYRSGAKALLIGQTYGGIGEDR